MPGPQSTIHSIGVSCHCVGVVPIPASVASAFALWGVAAPANMIDCAISRSSCAGVFFLAMASRPCAKWMAHCGSVTRHGRLEIRVASALPGGLVRAPHAIGFFESLREFLGGALALPEYRKIL